MEPDRKEKEAAQATPLKYNGKQTKDGFN